MIQRVTYSLGFLIGLFLSVPAWADEVTIEFSFVKRPAVAAVVYAADGNADPARSAIIDQVNKEFDDLIYVTQAGSEVDFKNSDTIDHNIFSRGSQKAPGFDIGLLKPDTGQKFSTGWHEGNLERIGCKIHPKMKAYIATVPNKHFIAIAMRRDGLQDSYSLTVDGTTTKIGILVPGYDLIETPLSKDENVSIDLIKRGKKKGSISLSRR